MKDEIIKDIEDIEVYNWASMEKILEKIVETYKEHEVENTSIPSAPDSTKFRASVSGKIKIRKQHISYGGRYDLDYYFPVCITVGGGIDREIHKEIDEIVRKLSDKMKGSLSCDAKKGSHRSKSGTNFSVYGLGFTK
jgi:hypothetical protein